MRHIVMFSGGAGSWAAAKRVVEAQGAENVTLLFTDTRMEDEDLYRFLGEAAANVGSELVTIADGRTPWQVFFDERYLGNSRIDPCSKILKRQLSKQWLREHCDPTETVVYVGVDWSEEHRYIRLRDRWQTEGWRYEAPLIDAPYLTKAQILAWLKAEGIAPPRLYAMGFAHNNCGGFCVKAGHAHFRRLLSAMPDRFAYHEQQERDIRAYLDADVSILTDTTNGAKRPLTLEAFRQRVESGAQIDLFDLGGCGCMVDVEDITEVA